MISNKSGNTIVTAMLSFNFFLQKN